MTVGERSLLGPPARYAGGWHTVAEGTHAWLQPNGDWGESNAGLVAGDGASLLVDTLWDERLTRRMLDGLPGLGAPPVTIAVNTHGDGDHVFGNRLVPADAEIVATAAAAAQAAHENPALLARLGGAAAVLERLPAFSLAGVPVRTGRYLARMLGPYDHAGVRLRPPTRTFTGTLTLDAGGREVRLEQVGPAHTTGDLVVHVPDVRVVFAADVLFAGVTPIMWSGPLSAWLAALQRLVELDPVAIVPGHGPVCGPAEAELLARYWRWLASAARRRAGMTPMQAARDILRSDDFGTQPWATWDSPERVLVNLLCLRHLARGPMTAGPATRLRLFAGMAALAAG